MTQSIKSIRRANMRKILNSLQFGNNQAKLARMLGKKPDYISRILADEDKAGAKGIGEELARQFERVLGLAPWSLDEGGDEDWKQAKFFDDDEEPFTDEKGNLELIKFYFDKGEVVLIHHPLATESTVMRENSVGLPRNVPRYVRLAVNKKSLMHRGYAWQKCFMVSCVGRAMEGGSDPIFDGDILTINEAENTPLAADPGVFAVFVSGEPMIRRLIREAGSDVVTLRADNPDKALFPDFQRALSSSELEVRGRVIQQRRWRR